MAHRPFVEAFHEDQACSHRVFRIVCGTRAPKHDASARDLKMLEGTWIGEWFIEAGQKHRLPDLGFSLTIVFKGGMITIKDKVDAKARGYRVKLDATKVPHAIYLFDIKGREFFLAIYALEGDTLKTCSGEQRPTDFTATTENGNTLFFLKRSK